MYVANSLQPRPHPVLPHPQLLISWSHGPPLSLRDFEGGGGADFQVSSPGLLVGRCITKPQTIQDSHLPRRLQVQLVKPQTNLSGGSHFAFTRTFSTISSPAPTPWSRNVALCGRAQDCWSDDASRSHSFVTRDLRTSLQMHRFATRDLEDETSLKRSKRLAGLLFLTFVLGLQFQELLRRVCTTCIGFVATSYTSS